MRRHFAIALGAAVVLIASNGDAQTSFESAKDHFERGLALDRSGDCAEAVKHYRRARELLPRLSSTLNEAQCLEKLARDDEALELFEAALTEFRAEISDAQRLAIFAKAERLRERVGSIDVSANVGGAALTIDARARGQLPLVSPIRVLPGLRVVRVTKPDHEPFEARVSVEPRKTVVIDAKLTRVANAVAPGIVTIMSSASLSVASVDGGAWHSTPWTVPLAPGPHDVIVRIAGAAPASERVEVVSEADTTVTLPPLPARGGVLRISSNVPARYTADAAFSGSLPLAAENVGPTPIRVEVAAPGRRPWVGVVAIPSGRTVSLDVQLVAESERRVDTLFWVGAGTTAALVAGAITTGLFALDSQRTFNGYVSEGRTRDDTDAARVANRGEALVTITNVLWVAAAVTGLASAGWLAFGGEAATSTVRRSER